MLWQVCSFRHDCTTTCTAWSSSYKMEVLRGLSRSSVKLYYNIKKVSWHGHSCRTLSTLRPVWWNFYTISRSLCLLHCQIYFLKCNDFNLRKKYTKATIYSLFILLVIWTKPNISHIVRKWITGQDCVYLCLFMKMYTIMVVWFWSSRNENTMSVSIRRMS